MYRFLQILILYSDFCKKACNYLIPTVQHFKKMLMLIKIIIFLAYLKAYPILLKYFIVGWIIRGFKTDFQNYVSISYYLTNTEDKHYFKGKNCFVLNFTVQFFNCSLIISDKRNGCGVEGVCYCVVLSKSQHFFIN